MSRWEQASRQSEEVGERAGEPAHGSAPALQAGLMYILLLCLSCHSLWNKEDLSFSGTRNLVCLSSFVEQMLKQNNISSQGFSFMYLSEGFLGLKIKSCQEVAQWVDDIAAYLDKQ